MDSAFFNVMCISW